MQLPNAKLIILKLIWQHFNKVFLFYSLFNFIWKLCTGFMWQCFDRNESDRSCLCEKSPVLSSHQTRPGPGSSEMDPLLAKGVLKQQSRLCSRHTEIPCSPEEAHGHHTQPEGGHSTQRVPSRAVPRLELQPVAQSHIGAVLGERQSVGNTHSAAAYEWLYLTGAEK